MLDRYWPLSTTAFRTRENVSWLINTDHADFFVKSAGTERPAEGTATPVLDLHQRKRLLRKAVELARSCTHPVLANLRAVIETSTGPLLVYDRAAGELVGTTPAGRLDPDSTYRQFAAAPVRLLLGVGTSAPGFRNCQLSSSEDLPLPRYSAGPSLHRRIDGSRRSPN